MLVYASLPSSMDRCTLVVMPNGAFLTEEAGEGGGPRAKCRNWESSVVKGSSALGRTKSVGRKGKRGEGKRKRSTNRSWYDERVEGRMKGRRARD